MKKKFWKRKRTNSNHVRYRNRHKQSQAKALVLSAILNTWLPRSNFICSKNTLLTAGCCKSELTCNKAAKAVKQCSIHYLSVELWIRRYNEETKFSLTENFVSSLYLLKSELRYLRHWFCLLCPGLVKAILGHSFGRCWYMRLFHTSRTSFLLTTRLWKHNSCSGFIFIPGKNLRGLLTGYL